MIFPGAGVNISAVGSEATSLAGQQLRLRLASKQATEIRLADCRNLVIAGWTGRDTAAVQNHINELVELGVRPPASIPTYYRASIELVTTKKRIQALGEHSSGEVEPILLALDDGLWVGVGSDHTDRLVETYSVDVSKQMCLKPIADEFWPLAEVAQHWDRITLRSHIRDAGGEWTLYQEGTLAQIRPAAELVSKCPAAQDGALAPGTMMFCGTFAAKGGIRSAAEFSFEMEDPVLGRTIRHAYGVFQLQRSDMRHASQQAAS
jgi:hypothetical protein